MPAVLVVARPDAPDPDDLLPLLRVLVARGHDVLLLATGEHRPVAAALDIRFRRLPDVAGADARRGGALQELFQALFVRPLEAHWSAVTAVLAEERVDVVVADALNFAACMLAALPRDERPPVLVLGTIPPPHAQPDAAPYGMGLHPARSAANRVRNLLLHQVMRRVLLRRVLPELRELFQRLSGHPMGRDTYAAARSAEVWAQCEPARFEYPLAVRANIRLVGPLAAARTALLPDGWDDTDPRPVVLVRGTRTASSLDLVVSAVRALTAPARLVAVTGVDPDEVAGAFGGVLPPHVRVLDTPASVVPPRTAVVVTRAYFVHVQHALQQGVPVVAVGSGGEEAETAARVAWHGCGVRIREDRPSADLLRAAVERVLAEPAHRRAAARIAAQAAGLDAEAAVAEIVAELAAVPDGDARAREPITT